MQMQKSLAAMALSLSLCLGGIASAEASNDVLTVSVPNFVENLEPAENYFSWGLVRFGIGECLVKYNDYGYLDNWLSDSWSIAQDGLTWTFHIKENAKFSNGKKVTGQAVASSLDRAIRMSSLARNKLPYVNIEADGQNVIITSQKPIPNMPALLADPVFLIIDTSETNRDFKTQGPVCTGPYKADFYSRQQALLSRNTNYWDGVVPFAFVKIKGEDVPNKRAEDMIFKRADLAINIASGDIGAFRNYAGYNCLEQTSPRTVLARLNKNYNSELSDINVRRALIKSVNKYDICHNLLRDIFEEGSVFVSTGVDYGAFAVNNNNQNTYDPQGAKSLLAKAGWRDTNGDGYVDKNGRNLELNYIYYTSRAEMPLMAEQTQRYAKQIGIKINLQPLSYNEVVRRTEQGDFDLSSLNILTMADGDPEKSLKTSVYASSNQWPNSYASILQELSYEYDVEGRRDKIKALQDIITEDAAAIIYGYPKMNMITQTNVVGAKYNFSDYYWITKDIRKI